MSTLVLTEPPRRIVFVVCEFMHPPTVLYSPLIHSHRISHCLLFLQ